MASPEIHTRADGDEHVDEVVGVGSSAGGRRLPPPRLGPPRAKLSDRGRQLLDDLETIFVAEGFAHLTVGELANRLHCSRRTLYELAPSKDELVLVVIDRRLRRFGRAAEARVSGLVSPGDKIEAFLQVSASERKIGTVRLWEDIAAFPAAHRLVADHYHYTTTLLGDLLEEGVHSGEFRPLRARVVAEIIDAGLDRLRDPRVLRAEGIDFREGMAELRALVRYGITADGQTEARSMPARKSASR